MAPRQIRFLKTRTGWILLVFSLLYLSMAGRLFCIQVLDNERYTKLAEKIRLRHRELPCSRGAIYDRTGRPLAVNVPTDSIYVRPNRVHNKPEMAAQLSQITGLTESDLNRTLALDKGFAYLGHRFPASAGDNIRKAHLDKDDIVGVEHGSTRLYPSGTLAAHVIGFTTDDGKGVEGLECSQNAQLRGKNGFTVAEVDPRGRIIPETLREMEKPLDGQDIVLTIDSYLQHVAEQALTESAERYNAVGASAVVMDPNTGEILALANFPVFNANDRKGIGPDTWRNRAVTDLYEPGSTLKAVTVCAGIEEGLSPTQPMAVCTKSGLPIGNRRIRCTLHRPYLAGHGSVDMFDIIRWSCNIGAASIARKIRPEKLYSHIQAFGLTDAPRSGMAGECVLRLPDPSTWKEMKLANVGFGQGVAVSAMQMACAYGAIANGGKLMRPQIIREIRDEDGAVVRPFKPIVVRRVIKESTARTVTQMLMGCVDEGTGKPSKAEGYTAAGKTGSAQKADPRGGYPAGKFIASFIGFVPAKNPRLLIYVVVDEPKGSHWGATVAAPVFKQIAQKGLLYLRVPPDELKDLTPPVDRSVRGQHDHKLGAGHTG